jgi:hypothetical protein
VRLAMRDTAHEPGPELMFTHLDNHEFEMRQCRRRTRRSNDRRRGQRSVAAPVRHPAKTRTSSAKSRLQRAPDADCRASSRGEMAPESIPRLQRLAPMVRYRARHAH